MDVKRNGAIHTSKRQTEKNVNGGRNVTMCICRPRPELSAFVLYGMETVQRCSYTRVYTTQHTHFPPRFSWFELVDWNVVGIFWKGNKWKGAHKSYTHFIRDTYDGAVRRCVRVHGFVSYCYYSTGHAHYDRHLTDEAYSIILYNTDFPFSEPHHSTYGRTQWHAIWAGVRGRLHQILYDIISIFAYDCDRPVCADFISIVCSIRLAGRQAGRQRCIVFTSRWQIHLYSYWISLWRTHTAAHIVSTMYPKRMARWK